MKKAKRSFSSVVTFLRRSKKTVLLIVIVAMTTLVLSALVSSMLSHVDHLNFPSIGTIRTIGIKAYWDEDLSNQTSSVPWGMIFPGSSQNVTLYLLSVSNAPVTLIITTANWTFRDSNNSVVLGPTYSSAYMNLTSDYKGATLNSGDVIRTTFTLHVTNSSDFIEFLIQRNVQQVSFDINIETIEK